MPHFATARARQHRQREAVGQPQVRARGGRVGRRLNFVRQGMADEIGPHAAAGVMRRLERKQTQHLLDRAPNALDATCTPRPDGGADHVHGVQAAFAQALLQAQVEIGRVDADHRIGLRRDDLVDQPRTQPEQSRQRRQNLGQAHQRQLLDAAQAATACRLHARPGQAEAVNVGPLAAQRLNDGAAQLVARQFARNKGQLHRASGRFPPSRKLAIAVMAASSPAAASAAICARTSAIGAPER